MEDEEYKKLSAEERCVHKLWKARVSAYEEVTKTFKQIDDEKSPEFGKYLGLVKKFVTDSNAAGQEKGLEATLAYVQNYAHAGKTVSEVMSGIVTKCIAAPRTKTRELALQVCLMYIEIEKYEAVEDELIKGTDQKNPKIVAACIQVLTTALREFGIKIISPKPIIKKLGILFADRDKGVRDETRALVIELYKWMGPNLKNHLQSANLQAVQMTELEGEFAKVEGQKGSPIRYIRSQQQKQATLETNIEEIDTPEDEEEEGGVPQEIDPYETADPIDILSKLPKDFTDKIEAKKWQDRKEMLEVLENLVKAPKLENGDYGDVVRALKKVVQKDSNVVCVALAGRCIAGLATGLKKRFQSYSGILILPLLEKFKEKKQNVVTAIREAIDATYLSTTIEPILEDVLEALNNKNPSVKAEAAMFLSRAFSKTQQTAINKKVLKAVTGGLMKNINESDPSVRESSAEALGTLMKLVGEKAVTPFLVELENDKLKMDKIKEFHDKAEIVVKVTVAKKVRPKTAPAKAVAKAVSKKPSSAKAVTANKKPSAGVSSGSATVVRSKGTGKVPPKALPKIEKELDDLEVENVIGELLPANVVSDLVNSVWKTRLAAAEEIVSKIQSMEGKTIPSQALVKTILKKPGLKDTNFQVLKVKLEIVKYLAENSTFSTTSVNCCICDISEKFGDPKNGAIVGETMTAMAEATSLGHVCTAALEAAFAQKSPKVQQEALVWLSGAVKEFGIGGVDVKGLIEHCKTGLGSNNPGVRQAAITMLGTLYPYMGATLHVFFENEKAALREQINAEFDKYEGETAPAPVRGRKPPVAKSVSSNSLDALEDDMEPEQVNMQDMLPRVDISSQITESLLNELMDKNWKERIEALNKLNTIIQKAKFLKGSLGDLPQPLAIRLTDSNVKIAQATLNICQSIAKSMGPSSKQFIRTWFPGIVQNLGDTKAWMRITALDTINAFAEQCGHKEFFEGEMVADALKSGSPVLRTELWGWLAEVLPKIPPKSVPKEELIACVPHLYSNLEDRSADVRKNAGEAVLGIMIHLGYDPMAKLTEKLKPGSKTVVMTALEKARPNLPTKPLPKKVPIAEEKTVRGTKAVPNKQNAVKKPNSAAGKPAGPSSRKKEEDVDNSPLLVVNNLKHQRTIDESKLKVLKWNFTQPREEFVDLLKDQMTAANVNRNLTSNMFHSDFRYHIKAIESLMDDLPDHSEALISNLDLILKWLTLRFFDTNPSVLLKGLEYLHSVFNMLFEKQYRMLENEGSCFIPYLVLKIGDPKDAVRNGVRALLKLITAVFPVSRLFIYVMEGVKSKNARQRAECLEVMGSMIEDYNITVCQPTPVACLKEVAKQISDRDNSVRNAALNCVVQAYNIVGEKVYKMVGNISDKEMTLLEERIKRSSRRSVVPKAAVAAVTVTEIPAPSRNGVNNNNVVVIRDEEDQDLDDEEGMSVPMPALPPAVAPDPPRKEVQGPFKLESEFMNDLDKISPHFTKLPIEKLDLEFLKEEIKMPSFFDNKAKIMPLTPPKPVVANRYSVAQSSPDPDIQKTVKLIGSQNLAMGLQGLTLFMDLMNNPGKIGIFGDYEGEFFESVISLLEYLHPLDPSNDPSVARIYRDLFRSIDMFYQKPILGKNVPTKMIQQLINHLIVLLVEQKLEKCGEAYIRVININCVKVIEQSDHTAVLCALVKLMTEYMSNDNCADRQIDLVMKCLWKVIKLMPTWGDHVDYESVLLEVHQFLVKFPSKWWTTRSADTPFRTIKTILHSTVKIKGAQSMQLLGKIPNPAESDIESYILKLVKSLKIAQAQDVPLQSQRNSLSLANNTTLTDIFQKIGNKDSTKEGLNLLYDFTRAHPEADIEPFLKNSSEFFQGYIRNGLKEIENSRKDEKQPSNHDTAVSNNVNLDTGAEEIDPEKTPEHFAERLNRWRHVWDELMAGRHVEHALWPLPPTE
ncbi:protein mini spindles [Euwallacea fornicatus]|uniref:protein mini spindles n=1 Tax=Euwallacea fornicatus TaxID=995702 RepID=UPI00338E7435